MAFMLLISPSPVFAAKACKDEGLVLQKLKQRVAEYGVAELNKKGGQFGETMLTGGIRLGCSNMAKYIIEQKPDLDIKNNKGYTALMVALAKKDFKLAKLLVEYGADVNLVDDNSISPLGYAINSGDEKIIKILLKAGANPNYIDNMGVTPLTDAITKNKYNLAEQLIKNGADVNLKNHYGLTPLFVAVGLQSEKAVKLLLENGSSTKVKMGQDDIFKIAEQSGNNQIIALLKKYSHK